MWTVLKKRESRIYEPMRKCRYIIATLFVIVGIVNIAKADNLFYNFGDLIGRILIAFLMVKRWVNIPNTSSKKHELTSNEKLISKINKNTVSMEEMIKLIIDINWENKNLEKEIEVIGLNTPSFSIKIYFNDGSSSALKFEQLEEFIKDNILPILLSSEYITTPNNRLS
jgi:hypothetical protein